VDWSSVHGTERRLGGDERYTLIRYQHFREAAARVAAAFGASPAVTRVALFGSVASSPSIESSGRRRGRLHEPKDVDLAVWVDGVTDLDALRKLTAQALNRLWRETTIGVAHHQVDIFLLDVTGKYFGRLCHFNQCPKHKPQCQAEGCGRVPFLQQHDGFVLDSDALAPERLQILYDRL
jgi:predicted nucleotidyltransferase